MEESGKVAVELMLGRAFVFRVKEFECAREYLANSGGTTVFSPSRFIRGGVYFFLNSTKLWLYHVLTFEYAFLLLYAKYKNGEAV